MQLKPAEETKIKAMILEALARHLDLKKFRVFIFGSRAEKRGGERSDIDLGIEGQDQIPANIFLELREEMETLPTLYKIDLVDFKKISPTFKKQALKNIKYLN